MASSIFLLLALATTPAPAHNFSTPSAGLLSTAGDGSVRAALRSTARSESASAAVVAGAASVHAALRDSHRSESATVARAAGAASVNAALRSANPPESVVAARAAGAASLNAALRSAAHSQSAVAAAVAGTASIHTALRSAGRSERAAVDGTGPVNALASTARAGGPGSVNPVSGSPSGSGAVTTARLVPAVSSTTAPPQPSRDEVSEVGRAAAKAGAAALNAAAIALGGKPATSPADADAHYSRGVEALKAKDTATAISELSACVQAVPSRVDCRWELGWAYYIDSRWSDALAQWTEVKSLQPDHPDVESALAQARGQAALQAKLSQAPQASTRPPPPPGARVRIRAVGDVMLGTTVPEGHLPPEGAASVIAGVRPLLEDADLTFVNLEGPLCDNGTTKKCRSSGNCYAFRSPTSYGQVLKDAGVDIASTANNHSGDFGELCRRETEATLDALGIPWSGPPGTVATIERNGLKIGMVAFHTSPSCNHLNNLTTATALVRAAAAEHDLVVVSFHGGAEGGKALHVPQGREMFFGEDRGDLRTFTRAVVDAGAHLVLGHGPHVARGMEFYKGRLIAYSMGNFATYGRFNLKGPQGLGMVLEVELDGQGRYQSGRILPTRQVDKGIALPDPEGAVIPLVRELTASDFPGTGARIAEDGTVKPPARTSESAAGSAR
jgi:hypothetical protein